MFEQHLKELVVAIAALVVAACVLKVVAVCIEEHTNENGVRAVMGKIKKYIIVGIISVCSLEVSSTIAKYYGAGHRITDGGDSVFDGDSVYDEDGRNPTGVVSPVFSMLTGTLAGEIIGEIRDSQSVGSDAAEYIE